MKGIVVDTYALAIVHEGDGFGDRSLLLKDAVAAALREAEENITDLLPDGYRAVITHWTGSEER